MQMMYAFGIGIVLFLAVMFIAIIVMIVLINQSL